MGQGVSIPPATAAAQGLSRFTVLDWIGVSLVPLGPLFCVAFAFFFAPAFRQMFRDFGGPLPVFTELVLAPWFPCILALLPLLLLALALGADFKLASRRGLLVLAFLLGLAGPAVCLAAAYAPIFSLAGRIQTQ